LSSGPIKKTRAQEEEEKRKAEFDAKQKEEAEKVSQVIKSEIKM